MLSLPSVVNDIAMLMTSMNLDGIPHPKRVKFEYCSGENLRLAANSDSGLPWYLSILSFKQTIEELIRNEYDYSDTNTVIWYTAMLATFP
ncbi:hypothetical protein N7455_012364 [Penicillium solitum]|uniref:uncharacterized protein n=1 Tax=Penicillium solitum TaxID=60172 RepID=UPI0032C47037|nr:hypothetical protein N7455_012364 [Penicillium solitum]